MESIEKYQKMVIDLFKEIISDQGSSLDIYQENILHVKKSIASAITEAKILNQPSEELCALLSDVESLNTAML